MKEKIAEPILPPPIIKIEEIEERKVITVEEVPVIDDVVEEKPIEEVSG